MEFDHDEMLAITFAFYVLNDQMENGALFVDDDGDQKGFPESLKEGLDSVSEKIMNDPPLKSFFDAVDKSAIRLQ